MVPHIRCRLVAEPQKGMLHHVPCPLHIPPQQPRNIAHQPTLVLFESGEHPLAVAGFWGHGLVKVTVLEVRRGRERGVTKILRENATFRLTRTSTPTPTLTHQSEED